MTQAVLRILQLQCKLKLFSWMSISSLSANRKCRLTPLPPPFDLKSEQANLRPIYYCKKPLCNFFSPKCLWFGDILCNVFLHGRKAKKKKRSCLSLLIKEPHLKLCATPLRSKEGLRSKSRLQRVGQWKILKVKTTEILTVSSEC